MRYFLFILYFISLPVLFGQEEVPEQEDIKIGLVLSGGGAKGFAHIEVLKKLDEAGIRIDYINAQYFEDMKHGIKLVSFTVNKQDMIPYLKFSMTEKAIENGEPWWLILSILIMLFAVFYAVKGLRSILHAIFND